jgi:hypothetical protein
MQSRWAQTRTQGEAGVGPHWRPEEGGSNAVETEGTVTRAYALNIVCCRHDRFLFGRRLRDGLRLQGLQSGPLQELDEVDCLRWLSRPAVRPSLSIWRQNGQPVSGVRARFDSFLRAQPVDPLLGSSSSTCVRRQPFVPLARYPSRRTSRDRSAAFGRAS